MKMGDRIKYLRERANMTQDDLGAIIGVQKSAIRKYEKGEVENIKRSSIKKMADAFGVSPCYLMGWDEETKRIDDKGEEVCFIEKIQMQYGKKAVQILQLFEQLNDQGKSKAIDTLSDLTAIKKYTQTEKVYEIKKAARNGSFEEKAITNNELDEIKNLPDVDDLK